MGLGSATLVLVGLADQRCLVQQLLRSLVFVITSSHAAVDFRETPESGHLGRSLWERVEAERGEIVD